MSSGGQLTRENSYRLTVFNNKPVKEQYRVGNSIQVLFYNKTTELVSERDWKEQSQKVFVPRQLGPRERVVNNWHKYSQFVLSHT